MCKRKEPTRKPDRLASKKALTKAADTFEYWDAERMAEAQPLPLDRDDPEDANEGEKDGKRSDKRERPE